MIENSNKRKIDNQLVDPDNSMSSIEESQETNKKTDE